MKNNTLLAAILAVMMSFTTVGDDPVVATVNGIEINASDVDVYLLQVERMLAWEHFERYDLSQTDRQRELGNGLTFERAVFQEAVEFAAFYKIVDEYARRLGVTVVADELDDWIAEILLIGVIEQEEIPARIVSFGYREFEHLEQALYSQMLLHNLVNAIIENPTEFATFERYMAEEEEMPELFGAKHIFAHHVNFDSEEEARAYAEDILIRIRAGEDFVELMREYGQDPGMHHSPDGYTFVAGVMVPEFEQAVRELEIGEISGLVKSYFGYSIIMRIEPNEDDILWPGAAPLTLEQKMIDAVYLGLWTMFDEVEIIFFY